MPTTALEKGSHQSVSFPYASTQAVLTICNESQTENLTLIKGIASLLMWSELSYQARKQQAGAIHHRPTAPRVQLVLTCRRRIDTPDSSQTSASWWTAMAWYYGREPSFPSALSVCPAVRSSRPVADLWRLNSSGGPAEFPILPTYYTILLQAYHGSGGGLAHRLSIPG